MGKGSGSGFHGTPGGNGFHTFSDNLADLTGKYPLSTGGYFGEPSERKNSSARIIQSESPLDTAWDFFQRASAGAERTTTDGPGKYRAHLKDETIIMIREVSSSDGSPAVDIRIVSPHFVKTQKIHFTKGEPK